MKFQVSAKKAACRMWADSPSDRPPDRLPDRPPDRLPDDQKQEN